MVKYHSKLTAKSKITGIIMEGFSQTIFLQCNGAREYGVYSMLPLRMHVYVRTYVCSVFVICTYCKYYIAPCRRNLADTAVSLLTSSRFPASLVSSIMALQTQIWPQLSVRIEKVLEVIAEVGQPLDGTTLTSSTTTDTYNLSQACPPEEVEVSSPHTATCLSKEALLMSINHMVSYDMCHNEVSVERSCEWRVCPKLYPSDACNRTCRMPIPVDIVVKLRLFL